MSKETQKSECAAVLDELVEHALGHGALDEDTPLW